MANKKTEKVIFAAGCFWGVQAAFDKFKGIVRTTSGYTGGNFKNPGYHGVCSGKTGHAEAVLIKFDPKKISYEKLLEIFWRIHNPTELNRQGPDIGSQYRSVIFYGDEKQKNLATKSKERESKKYKKPTITEIVKASKFYPAEEYHQKYYLNHPVVCHI